MTDPVVDVNNLSRKFDSAKALDGVNFQAAKGKVYGLVGANGAGKTTLIKHLLGLLRAEEGSVSVFGMNPVLNPKELFRRIGYLSEERDIPDWMTIDELMAYTRAYHRGWDQAYAKDLLATFALDSSKKIKDLSRGMRAQAALIAAVSHRPDLLILDEPSSGLDAIVRKDILNAIVRTISDDGKTVIFSSHLLEEVERMSDHVTMLDNGKVVLDGALEALTTSHHYCKMAFAKSLDSRPLIKDTLSYFGSGRSWSSIHTGSADAFMAAVNQLDGEVVETRNATLEEIFVARIGRPDDREGAR